MSNRKTKELSVEQSLVWNSVGSMVYLICNWLITVLVVTLGSDIGMSGSLAVAMSVGNIFATIVLLRARPVQVSESYSDFTTGNFIAHRIVATIFACVICFFYCLVSVAFSDWAVVAVYCLFKAGDSFVDVLHGVDQVNNRLDIAAISQIIRGVGVLVSFSLCLLLFDNLVIAVASMAIVTIAVVLIYDFRMTKRFCAVLPDFDFTSLIKLSRICFPGFVASLACTAVVSVTRQFYGLSYGNEALGFYAAVATPTAVIQALVSYLYAPLLGPISAMWRENETHRLRLVFIKMLVSVFVLTAMCAMASAFIGEPVLTAIYGKEVGLHSDYLPLALVATAFTGLNFFTIDVFIAFGKPIIGTISGAASLALAVFLSRYCFVNPVFASDANVINIIILVAYGFGLLFSFLCIINLLNRKAKQSVTSEL